MADIRIFDLLEKTTLNSGDEIALYDSLGGLDKKATLANVAVFVLQLSNQNISIENAIPSISLTNSTYSNEGTIVQGKKGLELDTDAEGFFSSPASIKTRVNFQPSNLFANFDPLLLYYQVAEFGRTYTLDDISEQYEFFTVYNDVLVLGEQSGIFKTYTFPGLEFIEDITLTGYSGTDNLVAWSGGIVIQKDVTLYFMEGISTTVVHTVTFDNSPSVAKKNMLAISPINDDILYVDAIDDDIYQTDGISSTIKRSGTFSFNNNIAYDGVNVWSSADSGASSVLYLQEGITTTISKTISAPCIPTEAWRTLEFIGGRIVTYSRPSDFFGPPIIRITAIHNDGTTGAV
jgi:hypothetical protein